MRHVCTAINPNFMGKSHCMQWFLIIVVCSDGMGLHHTTLLNEPNPTTHVAKCEFFPREDAFRDLARALVVLVKTLLHYIDTTRRPYRASHSASNQYKCVKHRRLPSDNSYRGHSRQHIRKEYQRERKYPRNQTRWSTRRP